MLLKLIKILSNSYNIALVWIFSINQNVFYVHNNKYTQCLGQNLINLTIKGNKSIAKTKKHYLVPKITISNPKSCFLFVIISKLYLIIHIYQLQLNKFHVLISLIEQFFNQQKRIIIPNFQIIELLIMKIKWKFPIFFIDKYYKCTGERCEKT